MTRHRAFTMIEVLVVVGIIGILVAMFFPALRKARIQSRRLACATNLRQIGVALHSYLSSSNDRLPHVSYVPSIGPFPLAAESEPVYIADVLLDHVCGAGLVLGRWMMPGRDQRTGGRSRRSHER